MSLLDRIQALSIRQQLAAAAALCLTVALIASTWIWGRTPDYRILYGNLPEREGGAIVASLAQMNIPYKLSESGSILVPANAVHETRLKLASQGLPKGGTPGFEILEQQKLGVTQFQEQVNYQRALEGELARSIQSLSAVQGARIHLAIPKPTVFLREQQKPSASVILSLHGGRTLDRSQIAGIVHLVAASVPELTARNVSVIDQNGALLNQGEDGGAGLDPSKLAYARQIEQAYMRRILDLIEPIVGAANVRVQVTADIDYTLSEQTAESFRPNQNAGEATVRSQQSSESASGEGTPAGVPGAPSNQPPGAQSATVAAAGSTGAARSNTRKDSTTNYEVDKTVRLTKESAGKIKRLNAAILINHRKGADKDGKPATSPLAKEEIEQVNTLVREAIGFNKERGDSISISNTAFSPVEVPEKPVIPMWKDPENLALAKEVGTAAVLTLLVFYLLFGVIRPLIRSVAPRPPLAVAAGADGVAVTLSDDGTAGGDATGTLPGQANKALPGTTPGKGGAAGGNPAHPGGELVPLAPPNIVFARARMMAKENPRAAALVLRKWLNGDE